MKNSSFERAEVNGIRLHVLPTDQFKTFAVSAYFGYPLKEETVTPVALAPFVLRRGTEAYPETIQFREKLDDMYGAGFGFDIYKRGDYQLVQFRMDVIHDQFVKKENGSLLEDSVKFLGEVLGKPVLDNGKFREKYVQAEKNSLKKKLESIINDKIRYAAERCIEEMCKNEPYRLHPLGKLDALEEINPANLYHTYRNWLRTAPIDLYVVGNTNMQEVRDLLGRYITLERGELLDYRPAAVTRQEKEVRTVVEKMDVKQGKLNMGLRTNTHYAADNYPAALIYNGILGGYPHSKLFMNVREKESLAYYAASRLDGHKGILTVQSGIEIENYEKAVDIIRHQLDDMGAGQISELELSQTRAMITNQLTEMQDSAFEMIAYDFNRILSGKERPAAELIQQVQSVDISQIQELAKQVQLDTIYFLRDQKGD